MANELTGTAVVTLPVNVAFTRQFLERTKYHMHYFMGAKPASLSQHMGTNTAFWRRHEHMTPTTTPLTELTDSTLPTRTPSKPTVTNVTKAVAKYGDHIWLTEEADLQNFNGQTAELLDVLAVQAGRSINMVQRNEMEDNATIVYEGNAASAGLVNAAAQLTDIEKIIVDLNVNGAEPFQPMTMGTDAVGTQPVLPAYWGICHGHMGYDVSKMSGFKSVETYARQAGMIAPGEFGLIQRTGFAVRFIQSLDSSIDADAGAAIASLDLRSTSSNVDVYNLVIYGKNAVGALAFGDKPLPTGIQMAGSDQAAIEIIQHARGSAGAADALNELATLGWKAWAAAKILNGDWIRTYRAGATNLDN